MPDLLGLENISVQFRGVRALDGVSLRLQKGEIVGVIGPNGAGKTTLVNVVTGVNKASKGTVTYLGRQLNGMRPDQIARAGISRTFQVMQPFPALSVLDNVTAAALFGGGAPSRSEATQSAWQQLEFCGLAAEAKRPASTLSLAGRKRLELAKSLAIKPGLLLLDEVNAGLNSAELDGALAIINRIAEQGITVLLIEHLMKVVTRSCKRVIVLHHGKLIADGETQDVMSDEAVISAYLGQKYKNRRIN